MSPLAASGRRVAAASLVVLCAACASSSASAPSAAGATGATGARPSSRSASDLILASDIEATGRLDGSAYDAVRRLRPAFLTFHGVAGMSSGAAGQVLASIDGGMLTAVESLRNLPASRVAEVRYLSATDAAQKFGTSANSSPVLLVKQK